jgi:flavin-dependent dehydrogenase
MGVERLQGEGEPAESYDLAIMGGGLSGLTLAIQLKQARPQTSILVAEKRDGRAPLAAFKVGESTVEMSAHYFADVVGMKDHLENEELPKAGLRFFFPAGDNSDIRQRVEWGAVGLPPVPSYQVDRGLFENALAERALELGIDLFDACKVEELELGEPHALSISRDGTAYEVRAPWVVDATGYAQLIKRMLGLEKDVEHNINSAWLRLGGGVDLERWVDPQDEAWFARMEERGVRKLSTNHLMGEGYWCWMIPLATGPISIGIVADPRFHSFDEISTLDAAIDWLKRHEPQLGAEIDSRRDDIEDFLKVENFAYSCERVFSPDRWALTGIAGVFADPFYSPGSDFIAQGNTYITDLVSRDLDGEDVRRRALAFNAAYIGAFETAVRGTYTDHYQLFGNAQVMTAKLLWEFAAYWATVCLPFFREKLTDLDFPKLVQRDVRRIFGIGGRIEQLFRDWHGLGQREWRDAFIANRSFPAFWQMHEDLHIDMDDETLAQRITENARVLEAVAVVIFHKAVESMPKNGIGAETRIEPGAISLDRDRWEKDGLIDDEKGLTLAEARERVPGLENMLLDEIVQPLGRSSEQVG